MSRSTSEGIATVEAGERGDSVANTALGLSLAAVITWVAGAAADELYVLMAVLAAAGLAVGVRARKALGREAQGSGRALAAIVVGGVLIALFVAFLVAAIATGDI
jgi:hypothetical protein